MKFSVYFKIKISFLFFLGSFYCFSQEKDQTENLYRTITQISNSNFQSSSVEPDYFSAVRVQQIGNYNQVNAESYSSGIEMNILQNGDRNTLSSVVRVKDYKLNTVQDGNDNLFYNNPIFSNPGTQLEVIQEGNNQYVENYGSNAISDKMSIRITGSDRSLIIQSIGSN